MVGSAAAVYANNDPVMSACAVARNTDAQIREMMDDFADGIIDKIVTLVEQDTDARPISKDLPALVRTLAATTTMTLTHDSSFIGRGEDPARAVEIVERLWLNALWGGEEAAVTTVSSPPWRTGAAFRANVVSSQGPPAGSAGPPR